MNNPVEPLIESAELASKVTTLYRKRTEKAESRFNTRLSEALEKHGSVPQMKAPWEIWQEWFHYATDVTQRSVLFWDILRERGNVFVEHRQAGKPPVLYFDYEVIMDGRTFKQPVNYALVRIVPPEGVTVDDQRRPYVIIDPRAGHGPGIGGYKDDSQVGVALEDGHPVYFVIFFPEPEPGQTLLDVCDAERQFIRDVHRRHPESAAPVVIGNCQGGWAAMMLASSAPEDTGPIVINGAPMSYWGGAWSEDEGENPMRYTGGLMGGSWGASFVSDLGAGKFDGAHLVQNFENLNPANTFWDKYYNLFSNVDTERERFLDFERWWGGFYMLNESEMDWIVQNLFVGNKLAAGGVEKLKGNFFDLRAIRSPIIVFASMGDNITPPQQAFNWIADVYQSTEEIKSRGQVIVGLLHEDVGHLGIFVSGGVARKEHKQIVSVLKSIEALPPGLWGMEIHEVPGDGKTPGYEVSFVEHKLEDVITRLNRFHREDEKAFEAVAAIAEFNQRAYDLFARPLVQAFANESTAEAMRTYHPMRFSRWAFSDLNPFTWWLKPAANIVEDNRRDIPDSDSLRQADKLMSEGISASLDLYRDLRDAASESLFFAVYGNIFNYYLADQREAEIQAEQVEESRDLPWIKDALKRIDQGAYPAAVARLAVLFGRKGVPIPLSRIELKDDFIERNAELLPDLPWNEWRLIRGRQDLIVKYEPELALQSMPTLLADPEERARFLTLMERLTSDPELPEWLPEQLDMLKKIRKLFDVETVESLAMKATV
ncbi:MAG: DUF3141 domain-containing protein [Gammaproteobacteria bacterium]|nr:DUF3141 domain-containing protein [Gammaproteobacteria bacterium]